MINITSLGRVAQTRPGFDGPPLGARLATENNRQFDEDLLFQGRCAPTAFLAGTCAHPAAQLMTPRGGPGAAN